jgi:hypothetical protein
METYKTVLGPETTLLLSTRSELFRFLEGASGQPAGPDGGDGE